MIAAVLAAPPAGDLASFIEGDPTCSPSRDEKHRVTDRQGIVGEQLHALGGIPVFDGPASQVPTIRACCADAAAAESTEPAACWTPPPCGKPIGIPGMSSASCCRGHP